MDVRVGFTNATRLQAEDLYKHFFHPEDCSVTSNAKPHGDTQHEGPSLDEAELAALAKRFADAIPEKGLSVCFLVQGICSARLAVPLRLDAG